MLKKLAAMSALAAALVATAAHAQVVIDNFASGALSEAFGAFPGDTTHYREQAGTMASGMRQWSLLVRGNPALGALVDVSSDGFRLQSNLGVSTRLDWFYGQTYVGHDHAMDLDLSAQQTLRFQFAEVERGLNFNVLMYFGNRIDDYGQLGVNILPSAGPVTVDFRLRDFVAASAFGDLSHVTGLYIVTQSGGAVAGGGEGFRLTSISALPESGGGMLLGAGLVALGLWRGR